MAMNFALANRAENVDLVEAMMKQAQLDARKRELKQNRQQMLMGAGLQIGDASGAFEKLGALGSKTSGGNFVTPTMVSGEGALASAAPQALPAITAPAGATAAGSASTAAPVAAGAAGASSIMPMLGLAALGYSLMRKDD